MYDIVDLEEDTIITSVNELCEVNNNKMLSKDSYEYSKNNFVDGSYYCKENENDYYAVMRTPRFTTSNLYFKVWRDFDDKNRKKQEKKKKTKKMKNKHI